VVTDVEALNESVGADLIRDSGGEFNRAQDALLHPGETSVVTDTEALKESVGADLVRDSGGEFILDRIRYPCIPTPRHSHHAVNSDSSTAATEDRGISAWVNTGSPSRVEAKPPAERKI
jgi:hypothetical protein